MKKLVLGMSVMALAATAAWAQDSDNTRVAAADPSAKAFSKLDSDADGRVSALEAANDTNVAASFTKADVDKDGYLSRNEFKVIGTSSDSATTPTPSPRSDTTGPSTSGSEPQQ